MASCLSVRSAAAPAKVLLKNSSLSQHCFFYQHIIIGPQLGVKIKGRPPLLLQPHAAEQVAPNFKNRLCLPSLRSSLRGTFPQLGKLLTTAHSGGIVCTDQLVSKAVAAVHSDAATESPSGKSPEPEEPHIPVLLNEVVEHFAGRTLSVYVDGTLGAAGHACAILAAHPELKTFIGLDVDPRAHAEARQKIDKLVPGGNRDSQSLSLHLVKSNFEDVHAVLKSLDGDAAKEGIDGMLLDLGVSSMQVRQFRLILKQVTKF